MTIPAAHENNLSKFIFVSFENDRFSFKSFNNINDRISVPRRCSSWSDLLRIKAVGNAIWIDQLFPKPMNQQEIFILARIGYDLTLEITEAIWWANIAFAWFAPVRCYSS